MRCFQFHLFLTCAGERSGFIIFQKTTYLRRGGIHNTLKGSNERLPKDRRMGPGMIEVGTHSLSVCGLVFKLGETKTPRFLRQTFGGIFTRGVGRVTVKVLRYSNIHVGAFGKVNEKYSRLRLPHQPIPVVLKSPPSAFDQTVRLILRSSAQKVNGKLRDEGRSLMCIKNSNGPRSDSRGKPLETVNYHVEGERTIMQKISDLTIAGYQCQ